MSYAHENCPQGAHTRSLEEETVTFICSATGEKKVLDRCIAINVGGPRVGQRCNNGAVEGTACPSHSRQQTTCTICEARVTTSKSGVHGHAAGHAFETLDGSHCWTCGLIGKRRYGTWGHVWDHEPQPVTRPYPTQPA